MKLNYKICHISSAHPGNDIRIFEKECVSLAEAGFDVSYVFAGEKSSSFVNKGVKCISIAKRKGRLQRMWKSVNEVCRIAQKLQAHAYHLHDPELLRMAKQLQKSGAKVVYDAHEDVPRQILGKHWIPARARKIIAKGFERYENQVVAKLDGLIAATPFIARRFKSIQPNTLVVNNYPFLVEFSQNASAKETKQNPMVIYAGGLTRVRGLFEMVQAIAHLPQAELILAGLFSPDSLREEICKQPGWEKVNYVGQLSRKELQQYYAKADVGLVVLHDLPNYIDAQPIKMYEYMSAGIPVVASNFPLWQAVVEGHACGICVNPYDSKAIAQAIQYILDHPERARQMGENGKKAIKTEFNWETQAQCLIHFYEQWR